MVIDTFIALALRQYRADYHDRPAVYAMSCQIMAIYVDTSDTHSSNLLNPQFEGVPSWLAELRSFAITHPKGFVLFPFNCGKHWVLARLCLSSRKWSFANSSRQIALRDNFKKACELISQAIWSWDTTVLSSSVTDPSTSLEDHLAIGTQTDSHSCGFFVLDAVRHFLFGTILSEQKHAAFMRLQTYLDIVDAHFGRILDLSAYRPRSQRLTQWATQKAVQ